jgi:hypothetical protein
MIHPRRASLVYGWLTTYQIKHQESKIKNQKSQIMNPERFCHDQSSIYRHPWRQAMRNKAKLGQDGGYRKEQRSPMGDLHWRPERAEQSQFAGPEPLPMEDASCQTKPIRLRQRLTASLRARATAPNKANLRGRSQPMDSAVPNKANGVEAAASSRADPISPRRAISLDRGGGFAYIFREFGPGSRLSEAALQAADYRLRGPNYGRSMGKGCAE